MLFEKADLEFLIEAKKRAPDSLVEKLKSTQSIFNMHIPKTGGTFFSSFFSQLPVELYHNNHFKCNPNFSLYPDPTDSIPRNELFQNQPGFNNSIKISIVRNPFDWLTSYYFHEEGNDNLPWQKVLGVGNCRTMYNTFEKFVEAYCDDSLYWPEGLKMFKSCYPFQIFDNNGNCQADFIIKNGSNNELSKAIFNISILLGCPMRESIKAFERSNKRLSAVKKKNYKKYYQDSMIEKLSEKWENILKTFNFDFFGSTVKDEIIIDGAIFFLNKDLKLVRKL